MSYASIMSEMYGYVLPWFFIRYSLTDENINVIYINNSFPHKCEHDSLNNTIILSRINNTTIK